MIRRSLGLLPLGLALLAFGCDDGEETTVDAGVDGTAYYSGEASAQLGSADNQARCSTCHSTDGSPLSGATLQDIAYRESYKGGSAATLLDATNACVTGWMGGEALVDGDGAWTELQAFMQSISDDAVTEANPLAPEVLADEDAYTAKYTGGDAAAGEGPYAAMCGTCHDTNLVVNNIPSYNMATLAAFSEGRIAQKVRTSGPPPSDASGGADTTPGPMPFFEPSDLSDDDLRNIVAFIKAQGA